MNLMKLMHETGADRMQVPVINDGPHPAITALVGVATAELLGERDRARAELSAANARIAALEQDAARYQQVRRGQHWSVIDGIGNDLRAEELDAAIDAARKESQP